MATGGANSLKARRKPSAGRRRVAGTIMLLMMAAAGLWLLHHALDHSDVFAERRGQLASAAAGSEEATAENYLTQSVRATATSGLTVDFGVLRPSAAGTPLPVLVLLGGHRTGRDAVNLVGNPQGVVVVALDYPYHGPERPRGVRQVLQSIPAAQRGLLDTPPAVSVALDWLATQPWADMRRVELMGVSLGVPFAAVAGALDQRFRRVWLIHGGVDNRAWLANRLERKISNRLVRETAATLLHLLAYGPTFRTERWTPQIAPRPLVIIGGLDDEQMPPENVRRLHAASREPKELLWTEGRHVGARRPEVIDQLLTLVRSRMKEDAASLAAPAAP